MKKETKEKIVAIKNPSIKWLKWKMRDQYLPYKEREIRVAPKIKN